MDRDIAHVLKEDSPTRRKAAQSLDGASLPKRMSALNVRQISAPLEPPRKFSLDYDVDMEDLGIEESSKRMAVLKSAAPKVRLVKSEFALPPRGLDSRKMCPKCGCSECPLIRTAPGYYTSEQVSRHDKPDDCWISAHGVVYDVTRMLGKHPGGPSSILNKSGRDCSLDFDFHSRFTRDSVWRYYEIGRVKECPALESAGEDLNRASDNAECVVA